VVVLGVWCYSWCSVMNEGNELDGLIERARGVEMTGDERDAQRRSFVYGNSRIANERITWEVIDRAVAVVTGGRRG
jgi:hypothetical protein